MTHSDFLCPLGWCLVLIAYLSLQSLAVAVCLLQLGLQLGAILLVLKLQGHQLLLQLLLGSLKGTETVIQLRVLGTQTARNKATPSSIGKRWHYVCVSGILCSKIHWGWVKQMRQREHKGGGEALGNVDQCTDLARSFSSCCCFCSAASFSVRSAPHSFCRLLFSFWWALRSSSFSALREAHSLCRLPLSLWWLFTMSCFSDRRTEHSFWRPLYSACMDCNSVAAKEKVLCNLSRCSYHNKTCF